jgi:DNA-binding transcriptional ArsR family regulator
MSDFKELDPLLHQRLRLAIMSLLVTNETAEFKFIKQKTEATAGNLSIQFRKLEEAGYLTIAKSFKGNYPLTELTVSESGKSAFSAYVKALKSYLEP